MANKNIKGITIEIGGNTTKLQDALKGVNKQVYSLNSDLKNLNQALKLNPSNIDLLSQKYDVLKRNIAESKSKLDTLKQAQSQMGAYSKLTDEQKSSYNALSKEIAVTENAIKNMKKELVSTASVPLEKLASGLKGIASIAKSAAEALVKVSAAVAGTMTAAVTAGVNSYAKLEQNIGGVETLFKDSADIVKKNASKAFETAGVSANEYMAGVTSFSASLLQSLGNNTAKAAEVADMAFRDMSDNANKFGSSMESITNAYQGLSKGQYQLLDNLKLGYGGTKTEMERLLADAQKITGVKYDISNLSDVYNAIHVIQNQLGVTGTTAQEASTTISGSFTSMKAALDNFLNGSGGVNELSSTIATFLGNVVKAIQKLAPNILKGIASLIKTLIPQLVALLNTLIPELFTAVQDFLDTIYEMLSGNPESLITFVTDLINKLVLFITSNLATIVDLGLKLIIALGEGLVNNIPLIIQSVLILIKSITGSILNNLPEFVSAALDIILALGEGLIYAIPELIEMIPTIIDRICQALVEPEMIEKIITTALRLIIALAGGLIGAIPTLLTYIPRIILSIVDQFKTLITKTNWLELGGNIVKGICDGFVKIGDYITKKVKEVKNKIIEQFKKIFDIHSPSKLMEKTIGLNISYGIGVGIQKGIPDVIRDVKSAMVDLNNGIQASVNPIINPQASTTMINFNVDKFYNKRDQDIQSIAEELEYYRRKNATATGGN